MPSQSKISSLASESLLSVGAVVRLTGLSEHVLRAWERRYEAVVPIRTPGGTRRYRESDVRRLRLLRDAIAAGNRIGDIANLEDDALRALTNPAAGVPNPSSDARAETLRALTDFDMETAKKIIALQLAALGPRGFAKDFVSPMMFEIGEAWAREDLCIGSEHLGTTLVRGALETALRATSPAPEAPVVVFGTPSGERHEIGLLVASIIAQAAGANPLYLGPDLPVEELVFAANRAGADAVAISVVTLDPDQALQYVNDLRRRLSQGTDLWIGGAAAMETQPGVHHVESLDELERRVSALHLGRGDR